MSASGGQPYSSGGPYSSPPYHAPSAPPAPPSAPPVPDPYRQPAPPPTTYYGQQQYPPPPTYGQFPSYGPSPAALFPPGTDPNVIRSFELVDRDRSGYIDEIELQQALCSGYQKFSLRTIRLLMFLYRNPKDSPSRIGPKEFAALWSCLGQWRDIFARFDRDRSGKIDTAELRDALYSIGYAVPPSVLDVLMSKYNKYDSRTRKKVELDFDSFIECGMIVKGLTEKFKEKDPQYTGSATLTYDAFMCMVIPFIVSDN